MNIELFGLGIEYLTGPLMRYHRKPGYLFPVNIQLTGLHEMMILRRTTVGGVDILLPK